VGREGVEMEGGEQGEGRGWRGGESNWESIFIYTTQYYNIMLRQTAATAMRQTSYSSRKGMYTAGTQRNTRWIDNPPPTLKWCSIISKYSLSGRGEV